MTLTLVHGPVPAISTDDLDLPQVTVESLLVGLGILVVGWLLSRLMRLATHAFLTWRGRSPSASKMFASLSAWIVLIFAFAAAMTVIFPSVKPVNALGGIGVLSIAAGIAFQTVLGNMFAGIVILARDVFRVDDQIAVGDTAGTVTAINLTSTVVRTYDGRLVLIPNSIIHSEIVSVQTGYEYVRNTISVDIDDAADLDLAVEVAERAMADAPEVLREPAPQALLQHVGSATVRMDLRFWSGARQMDTRRAQHQVIRAVLDALRGSGVKTGSDVLVVDAAPRLLAAIDHEAAEDTHPGS